MYAVIGSLIALGLIVAVVLRSIRYARIRCLAPESRAILRKIEKEGAQAETQLRNGLSLGLGDFHKALDELNREGYIWPAAAHDDELIWAIRR